MKTSNVRLKRINNFYHWLMQWATRKYRMSLDKAKIEQRLYVTDHAVLRYLERVKNIDMGIIRAEILNSAKPEGLKYIGDGVHKIDKHRIVISGGTVKTVLPERKLY